MSWFADYKKSLKIAVVEEYIDLIFYRPLAFLLVKSVYNSRITPDHLTYTAIIAGSLGGLFYAFGSQVTCKIAACLYLLYIILDCSDGQLARLKKNGSAVGRILDGIADYSAATAVYIGIAIGYSAKEGVPSFMLIQLALSGASIIIQEMLVDFHRTRFLDIIYKRKDTFTEGIENYKEEYLRLKNIKGKWFETKILYTYLLYSKLQRKLTSKRNRADFSNISPEEYYKKNRVLIRLWVLLGPSAVKTTLIVCSLYNRFDIYFWVTIVALNIYAVIMLIIQRLVDKSYTTIAK
jgi:phosphatidylglycerophosphate synthase